MSQEENSENKIAMIVVTTVVAAIVLASLWWVKRAAPVAAPAAAVSTPSTPAAPAPAAAEAFSLGKLALAFAAGKLTISGDVPTDRKKDRILSQAKLMFGDANVVDQINVKPDAMPVNWKGKTLDLMSRLTSLNNSPSGFTLNLAGNAATINGEVGSEDVQGDWGKWLNGFFVDGLAVTNNLKINPALANAPKFDPNVLLNEAIEFASGSAVMPEAPKLRLQAIANVLREDGRKVKITGHTDSQGNAESNKKLSRDRAESVKAFLVSVGAPGDNLMIDGAGADRPVADNATAEGRQRNRRIEFANQ
jgi:OmpA-OmpF porin, OOP family